MTAAWWFWALLACYLVSPLLLRLMERHIWRENRGAEPEPGEGLAVLGLWLLSPVVVFGCLVFVGLPLLDWFGLWVVSAGRKKPTGERDEPRLPRGGSVMGPRVRRQTEGATMPHDMNGRPLKAGDRVMVPCLVRRVDAGEEYCNLTLDTELPMYPSENKTSVVLNARQVVVADAPAAPPAAPEPAGDTKAH